MGVAPGHPWTLMTDLICQNSSGDVGKYSPVVQFSSPAVLLVGALEQVFPVTVAVPGGISNVTRIKWLQRQTSHAVCDSPARGTALALGTLVHDEGIRWAFITGVTLPANQRKGRLPPWR